MLYWVMVFLYFFNWYLDNIGLDVFKVNMMCEIKFILLDLYFCKGKYILYDFIYLKKGFINIVIKWSEFIVYYSLILLF